jgi:RNA polymerase sigma factor (sigma-70 family)
MEKQYEWSAQQVAEALTQGRSGAWRAGIYGEDTEDCAAAFMAYLWQKRERIAAAQIPAEKERAFLRRCAYRFAISWARRERRNPLVMMETMDVFEGTRNNPCEAATLHTELWQLIAERLADLAPHQQVLFMRCYVHEEEREVIASEQGCTANAIKKVAQRARARLQTLLDQAGLSEPHLREYLG